MWRTECQCSSGDESHPNYVKEHEFVLKILKPSIISHSAPLDLAFQNFLPQNTRTNKYQKTLIPSTVIPKSLTRVNKNCSKKNQRTQDPQILEPQTIDSKLYQRGIVTPIDQAQGLVKIFFQVIQPLQPNSASQDKVNITKLKHPKENVLFSELFPQKQGLGATPKKCHAWPILRSRTLWH